MSELIGKHLHLDCISGAAGDMALGALIDLGVPEAFIRDALDRVGIGGERLSATRVLERGIAAVDVKVDVTMRVDGVLRGHEHGHHGHEHGHHEHGHEHRHHGHGHGHHGHEHGHHGHEHGHHEHGHEHHAHHGHEHAHHDHHHYRDIRAMITGAELAPEIARRALDMFDRVARAEAKLHGTTIEDVAFHEVGAIDSIVDIVGTAAALAWLAPAAVTATSVAMGHGRLDCAHGVLPVPAPAALEILREAGGVMESGGVARELCTPTGAAILASAVTAWQPMPPLVPLAVGYGAGDADLPDRANVVRAVIGRPVPNDEDSATSDRVWRLEANIDDMSPEMCEHAAQAAFAAGALDVWWTPIIMKKGRPALELAALAPDAALDPIMRALFTETTTIGVRFTRMSRRVLARNIAVVDTPYGQLPIKLARMDGQIVNAAPEFEPCRQAAETAGVPLKQVFAAALCAYARSSDPDA